jgi:hypothetical protein
MNLVLEVEIGVGMLLHPMHGLLINIRTIPSALWAVCPSMCRRLSVSGPRNL